MLDGAETAVCAGAPVLAHCCPPANVLARLFVSPWGRRVVRIADTASATRQLLP